RLLLRVARGSRAAPRRRRDLLRDRVGRIGWRPGNQSRRRDHDRAASWLREIRRDASSRDRDRDDRSRALAWRGRREARPARAASIPRRRADTPGRGRPARHEEQLDTICALLLPVSGVDFKLYKSPTIKRRLQRRMALHRLSSSADYIRLLGDNPGEVTNLYHDILIHVTRFFR